MKRSEVLGRLPLVLGLSQEEAAAAVGLGTTKFAQMVAAGTMPPARVIGSRRVWDVDELRAAFKNLPHEGEDDGGEIHFAA